jgi:hypothetical protein
MLAAAVRTTPQQQAAATVHAQEAQVQAFLHRLQKRQERHTVPMALSRRMLQRHGVGYLDDNVASVVSATADRFLATVLQQAMACRDQRLKGAELMKEERRHRRKHVLHHKADADDRKRRKLEREETKKKTNLKAIAAAEALKATGATPDNSSTPGPSPSKSKKKKKSLENGDTYMEDDDDHEYDSLEEEEEYYREYYGNDGQYYEESDDEDEDENQYMLMLRDLERPLQAWDVHLTGKVGLGVGDSSDAESDDERDADEQAENGDAELKVEQEGDEESQSSPPAKTTVRSPASKGVNSNAMENAKSVPSSASRKAVSPAPKSASASGKAISPVPKSAST